MKFTRRRFIRAVGAGVAGGYFNLPVFAQSSEINLLKIPDLYSGQLNAGVHHYDLAVQPREMNFLPGLRTSTMGINSNYLGPTLRFRKGDDVTMHVKNHLGEPTTLHWHGLHVPAKSDGGPGQIITAGAERSPEFQIFQDAGTFWYHSHALGKTGEQVYRGLAGFIIIEDPDNSGLDLPSTYAVDDIPLIVQDRSFQEDGDFIYLGSHMDVMPGMHGDTILVNGTIAPLFVPTTSKVRFRLLNAANARTFNFAFDDNRLFQLIGSDGGLLNAPVALRNLELAPA